MKSNLAGFAMAAALGAFAALPALAAAISPSAILANPSSFDGKSVTVSGAVAHFQTSKTMMGTVAAYQVCDAKCVLVIDKKNHAHADGDNVTVSGIFHTTFKGPKRTFNNVVML
jgi:hypothetical protein